MAKKRSKTKALKVAKSLISNDLNKSAAARELGVSPQAIQKQVNENPLVRSALEKYLSELEAQGVGDKESVTVIKEAMQAEKTVAVEDFTGEEAEEEREQFEKKGLTYRKVTEPDHAVRLKANEQYLKVKKLLADSAPPAGTGGKHIHFHFGEKADDELCNDIAAQLASLGGRKPGGASRGNKKGKD